MRQWKYGIAYLALCMMICASFSASAISVSDPIADVQHISSKAGTIYVANVSNKPNIDITQLSAIINGDSMTLSLTVLGTFQSAYNITYWAWVNSTDTQYTVAMNWDLIFGFSMNRTTYQREYTNGSVKVNGNTLSAVFNITSSTSLVYLSAMAKEGTLMTNVTTRNFWYDEVTYVNTENNTGTDNDNNTGTDTDNNTGTDTNNTNGTTPGKQTPGFELLPVIAAVTITAILIRRRH